MIIWIASYPKSGNTWVRSFLSTYYFSKNNKFDFNLLKNIPQYPTGQFIKEKISKPGEICQHWKSSQDKLINKKSITFLKTHNALVSVNGHDFANKDSTLGVIYIVRDPRNVLTSIKNHYDLNYENSLKFMKKKRNYLYKSKNFSDFQFIGSWADHYRSWYENKFNKIIIKYEDLEKSPNETFLKLIQFINQIAKFEKQINENKVYDVVKLTEFNQLKKMEIEKGFDESVLDNDGKIKTFFNMGFENKWKKTVPINMHETINKEFDEDLKRLGYIKMQVGAP